MTITKAKEILEDSFTVINTHGLYTADEEIEAQKMAIEALKREQQFLDAGYKNQRVEFYIGGRKFMVKEMAQ